MTDDIRTAAHVATVALALAVVVLLVWLFAMHGVENFTWRCVESERYEHQSDRPDLGNPDWYMGKTTECGVVRRPAHSNRPGDDGSVR